ncbi:MAG: TIGR03617 family F420-dependent LLM class oxidoreductase [Ectothiorhodospiraceae bacterium]|nr:TIGR03617 family F420-dependent LLM class oxidoreductase [Chromatiales bacterium]MCP5154949.1 TIGR03617 family F420-dependent LLM class oxidoreductase [Ectothiorhodospiraceae bacterium]
MRIATGIVDADLRRAARAARAAEDAGYDVVLTMENRHDPFLPLAGAAITTSRVTLATSVAIAFPRSPMVVANVAHDLQVASEGRFVLGLGTQVKGHNERRFSVPWSAPAPRLEEYVQALRAIWACWRDGGPLEFQGEHYRFTLMPPNFRPPAEGVAPIPVTIAAVGAAMLRLAGRRCDGVRLHPFCTRRYLETVVLPELGKGLARAGRPRERFEVSGGGFLCTGPDEESVARAVEWVRYRVAFYGSTRTYFPVWEAHGLEDLGHRLHRLSVEGAWDRLAGCISDDVLRLFAAVGTHDVIAGEVAARYGGLVDVVNETQPTDTGPGLPPDLLQDLRAIPCPFAGF